MTIPDTEIHTPAWVHDAVFYQIFPDRFAKSESLEKPAHLEAWDSDPTEFGYKGGDLIGVTEHLDYLEDLGVTALYFNPIFQSAANHRYHTHDYYQVDPLLGGNEAFERMLAACHARGLKVVLDGVFNHASRGFFQFNDVLENGAASPWLDWFQFHEHPANAYDHNRPPGYRAWVGLHALPAFNTDDPQVREYIMRIGEYWVRQGIDGWRLDVPFEIRTPGFWAEFRERIRAINPEAYLVGEIWNDAREWLQGDQFDATMNYQFTGAALAFAGRHRVDERTVAGRDYQPWPGITGEEYRQRIDRLISFYPWPIQLAQLNLLDSHDTSRALSVLGGDVRSLELASLLLFTYPGAPSIYAGSEIGVDGALDGDRWARKSFPWGHPEAWNRTLLETNRSLIAMRGHYPALRTGAYESVAASADSYAFVRRSGDSRLLVALNTGDEPDTLTVPLDQLRTEWEGVRQVFVLGEPAVSRETAGSLALELPPRSGTVLELIDPG
jgi:cyclomaltodextrinase